MYVLCLEKTSLVYVLCLGEDLTRACFVFRRRLDSFMFCV